MNNAAIGIFDSGLGGLTVAREIAEALPDESLIYVGDQARCPYGPRDSFEVQNFVQQIATFLSRQEVKLIVIACNTATSCGLDATRQHFDLPIIGVINAGARAAVEATQANTVAVIGTQRTIESAAYPKAIHKLNAQVKVIGQATPELTNIVESGLEAEVAECVQKRGDYYHLVESYLCPLLKHGPDTLLLGCTHYPVLIEALQAVAGEQVKIICTANEVAAEVKQFLTENDALADDIPALSEDNTLTNAFKQKHIFYTTGSNTENFAQLGSRIFGEDLEEVRHLSIEELTA